MRGSPLLRSLFVAVALLAAGAGLARVTSARTAEKPRIQAPEKKSPSASVPFHLTLSAPATEIILDGGTGAPVSGSLAGSISLDPENPTVSITVRWKDTPSGGEHRFAKLTLEPSGQATFTHVFDASGDIDDLLELPLPAGK